MILQNPAGLKTGRHNIKATSAANSTPAPRTAHRALLQTHLERSLKTQPV
jgi:hypothetical protein